MIQNPFNANVQICKSLEVVRGGRSNIITRATPPYTDDGQTATQPKNYLPGEPRIRLGHDDSITGFLKAEYLTPDLDKLAPHLWLVSTPRSSHISSLTHQIVRGREIVITENPGLHLVWYYNRVFIKPLSKYLLSHTFWDYYLTSATSPIPEPHRSEVREAALRFLRSYFYLVQRRSDFNIAMHEDHRLLPKGVKYAEFVALIESLEDVADGAVSKRYSYGQLRLTRLNFWAKIFIHRFTYHKAEGQYGPYFARFYGPILFLFGIFSVLLSAMQVARAVVTLNKSLSAPWVAFASVSRGFSIFTLLCITAVILCFFMVLVVLVSREIVFTLKHI